MGLVERLGRIEPDETVLTLDEAALRRYIDGVDLSNAEGAMTASVYLLGYAAEIILKVACFYADGLPTGLDNNARRQTLSRSQPYRRFATRHASGHSIPGWYKVLLEVRRERRKAAYNDAFRAELYRHVLRIERNWSESLRYKRTEATQAELARVYKSVTWIVRNRSTLYS